METPSDQAADLPARLSRPQAVDVGAHGRAGLPVSMTPLPLSAPWPPYVPRFRRDSRPPLRHRQPLVPNEDVACLCAIL
jgi:hypothetical protein